MNGILSLGALGGRMATCSVGVWGGVYLARVAARRVIEGPQPYIYIYIYIYDMIYIYIERERERER